MLLLIIALAAIMESSVAIDTSTCDIMVLTDGCSVPFNRPFPYKDEFRDACNMHDVCYVCGKTNNWTRAECDLAFLKDLRNYCNTTTQFADNNISIEKDKLGRVLQNAVKSANEAGVANQAAFKLNTEALEIFMMVAQWHYIKHMPYKACMHGANIYYKTVRAFGEPSYDKTYELRCTLKCAKKLGNPY
ncbi:conodipine-P3-like isoform X2 [Clytia hemisphaerica]|uniref:Conodipine-M alpha chain n=1 Tax=Clytia hemisphaerica TaxID=252671 RepID=A0A7M5X4Z2_9CNID